MSDTSIFLGKAKPIRLEEGRGALREGWAKRVLSKALSEVSFLTALWVFGVAYSASAVLQVKNLNT